MGDISVLILCATVALNVHVCGKSCVYHMHTFIWTKAQMTNLQPSSYNYMCLTLEEYRQVTCKQQLKKYLDVLLE